MPHTNRRQAALRRCLYTGESLAQARAGIARGSHHGLDHCTSEQRTLRALIAVGVFNQESIGAPPKLWGTQRLVVYGTCVSPRFDDLVLLSTSPDNVARCFVPWRHDHELFFPGWRAVCVSHHVRLLHLPTGTTLGVEHPDQRRRTTCANPCPTSRHELYASLEQPLTEQECTELGAVPPMSEGARTLLAALVSRMSVTAADHSWAVNWFLCPPGVPTDRPSAPDAPRMLWGSHDRWRLSWRGFPDAEYVASALTDPHVGLDGAEVLGRGTRPWSGTEPRPWHCRRTESFASISASPWVVYGAQGCRSARCTRIWVGRRVPRLDNVIGLPPAVVIWPVPARLRSRRSSPLTETDFGSWPTSTVGPGMKPRGGGPVSARRTSGTSRAAQSTQPRGRRTGLGAFIEPRA